MKKRGKIAQKEKTFERISIENFSCFDIRWREVSKQRFPEDGLNESKFPEKSATRKNYPLSVAIIAFLYNIGFFLDIY